MKSSSLFGVGSLQIFLNGKLWEASFAHLVLFFCQLQPKTWSLELKVLVVSNEVNMQQK